MGSYRAILLALALGVLATATLSACGSEDNPELLPGETASEINANLDLIEDLVAAGDCVGDENAAAAVREQVEALTGVDQELKEALSKGAARLNEVIGECEEAPEEETTASEEPDLEALEKEQRDEEKAQEKAEKEAEKEQKQEEKPDKETPPTEPPGQEEPKEEPEAPPTEPSTPPSGGVSPSAPAGGAE